MNKASKVHAKRKRETNAPHVNDIGKQIIDKCAALHNAKVQVDTKTMHQQSHTKNKETEESE